MPRTIVMLSCLSGCNGRYLADEDWLKADLASGETVRLLVNVRTAANVRPETSDAELLRLLDDAEDVCRRLGLRHRVVQMCTGDLSFVACMKYDVELWAPGCGEWLEVSSISDFGSFQARRAGIRFRRDAGAPTEFVHTLNGSGLGLPRTMIAVLENNQAEDGRIRVPEVLRERMGADWI